MKTNCSLLLVFFLTPFMVTAQNVENGWVLKTKKTSPYTGIVVANGRIGILPGDKPFEVKSVLLNNVYEKESALGVSRILLGMNFGNLELRIDGERVTETNVSGWEQILNMKKAAFTTHFRYKDKAEVTYTFYALRNVQYSGYLDIRIEALKDIEIKAKGLIETPAAFKNPINTFRILRDLETTMPILQTVAQTQFGRHTVATSGTFIWHDLKSTDEHIRPELKHSKTDLTKHGLEFEMSVKQGKQLDFAWTAAQCSTQDFNDPQGESERFVIFNLLNPKKELLKGHFNLWDSLWRGDIIIDGDLQSQLDVRLALYHLYAFSRADSDLSIAPMGLSSQNYNGHIFWDTELWMYPPLLLLNTDIALALLNYRSERLPKAIEKAQNFGFKGAMFPWESDDTGEESTPAWALTGTFEHHITADVAIAFWNYFRVTKDKKWLAEKGYPMLEAVADYWVSRVTVNKDGSFSINNVVGANEFAPNVNDNAFTNGSAITALLYADQAAHTLSVQPKKEWLEVAKGIRIVRFADGTTREHSTYNGEIIKQADVNLLSYPLDIVRDRKTILKDLRYYEPRLSPEGPAMGQSIFAVLYARLGNAKEAYRLFKRSYEPNKRPPFGALAEAATSNNPYFATGAGGMLQVVLFGFGGIQITSEGVVQKDPILPKEWKSLTIKGVGPDKREFVVD